MNTYAQLKSTLLQLTQRDDITTLLPLFIQLTEADIQSNLRELPVFTESSTFTITPTSQYLNTVGVANIKKVMLNIGGDTFELKGRVECITDVVNKAPPVEYCIEGKDVIKFYPCPDATYTGAITYTPFISPLLVGGEVSEDDTNWLLQNHPDVYIYGCLTTIHTHLNTSEIGKYEALYKRGLSNVKNLYKVDTRMRTRLY